MQQLHNRGNHGGYVSQGGCVEDLGYPRRFVRVNEIPRTALGKVQKHLHVQREP